MGHDSLSGKKLGFFKNTFHKQTLTLLYSSGMDVIKTLFFATPIYVDLRLGLYVWMLQEIIFY